MQPHTPKSLPLDTLNWISLITLLGKVNAEVARYDGLLQTIQNPAVLLSPLTTQEAVLSSKIEGTQATFQGVLEYEAAPENVTEAKAVDIREVLNYRRAMNKAISELDEVGFTLRLLKNTHRVLLEEVRGGNANIGEFRVVQNWIGKLGTGIGEATYIPPSPEKLPELLGNWETYLNSEEKDPFVQLAIIHAQFEMIHPFIDGNGRIGRITLPLFLFHKGVISSPMFYLSAYFETHRDEYYSRLGAISKTGDWNQWIEYFLMAIIEQAKLNSSKARAIHNLHSDVQDQFKEFNFQYAIQVIKFLFSYPIFNSSSFIESTGMTRVTAGRTLRKLQEEGFITRISESRGRKPAVFTFDSLLNIVK